MELGDLLVKIANNARLTPQELDVLKRIGNETQQRNNFVAGNTSPQNTLDINFPFFPIYSQSLESPTSSITVTIPSGLSNVIIMGSMRTDAASFNDTIGVRFNDDSGANYRTMFEGAQNTTQIATQNTSATYYGIGTSTGANATSGSHGNFLAYITNVYGNAWKSVLSIAGTSEYSASDVLTLLNSGHWKNTTPISTMQFFSTSGANLVAGCLLSIYGIR